jgi:DHA1 family tetracycline resistance protein-like MFS transporter
MLSLSVMSVELLALGAFPSVVTLFATAAMSGMANSAMAVGFAIVTDLSDGRVTSNMGYFSAVFGLGFIVGPLCGSLLIDVSLQLCFLVAGAVCLCSLGFTYLCVEETCLTLRPYDPSKGSPLSSLRVFFANKDLRSLAVPYCLSNLCTGIYFVWVLYMQVNTLHTHTVASPRDPSWPASTLSFSHTRTSFWSSKSRYDATILQIGAFLSVSGACSVMVQGVAVPWLIPTVLSDERATIIGLALSCLQLLAYGFSPALWTFYLILIMLRSVSPVWDPSNFTCAFFA